MSRPIPPYPSSFPYANDDGPIPFHPDWKRVTEWAKKIEALPRSSLLQGIYELQQRVKQLEDSTGKRND